MSQQGGAWQTAASRSRNSQSSSRTPQNRSGTASPNQQGQPTQPPKAPNNVWTQNRSGTPSGVNGPTKGDVTPSAQEEAHQPLNGFNAGEVKAMLRRGVAGQSYKVVEDGAAGSTGSGGAWGAKPNAMANGQPFFVQLAKQVAATEGGG